MATVEDVLNTARMYLNDVNNQLWADTILMPMFTRAHQELQVTLRQRAAPIMKGHVTVTIAPGTLAFPAEPDLVSPIQLLESVPGQKGTLMTESDPLPNTPQGSTLNWWQWDGNVINFIGATTSRQVTLYYWRSLTIPTVTTATLIIIDAEMWLAPRTAALAAASVGEENTSGIASTTAEAWIEKVILTNRGRAAQDAGISSRP